MDKFDEVRRLREEYESTLDEVESKRAGYHAAVRRLSMLGVPLREIAQQLGLSHQRVHQIVGPRDEQGEPRSGRAAGGIVLVLVLAGIVGSLVGPARSTDIAGVPDPENRIERALLALATGDRIGFSAELDDRMRRALQEGAVSDRLDQVVGEVGAFRSGHVADAQVSGPYLIVSFDAVFERDDDVKVTVVFERTGEHRIAGLWFASEGLLRTIET